MVIKNDRYTYRVTWSEDDNEYVGDPGKGGKRRVLSKIEVLPPGTICTETYLVIGAYTKDTYAFVPIFDMSTAWTDEMLYKRYGPTKAEIEFIESKIRPMEANNG